jgi:hypothetical protein
LKGGNYSREEIIGGNTVYLILYPSHGNFTTHIAIKFIIDTDNLLQLVLWKNKTHRG